MAIDRTKLRTSLRARLKEVMEGEGGENGITEFCEAIVDTIIEFSEDAEIIHTDGNGVKTNVGSIE